MTPEPQSFSTSELPPEGRTLKLRQEELVMHKEMRHAGDVEIRTEVEEVPGHIDVDAVSEEVSIEHVPVGRVVSEREAPWKDGEVLVVPIYEEQLVVTKRLVLREELRVRRMATTEHRHFEDTLRRDRLIVEEPAEPGLLHERYPGGREEGFLDKIARRVRQ
jgi:uncharacterized protein (TIGR02271 family)